MGYSPRERSLGKLVDASFKLRKGPSQLAENKQKWQETCMKEQGAPD